MLGAYNGLIKLRPSAELHRAARPVAWHLQQLMIPYFRLCKLNKFGPTVPSSGRERARLATALAVFHPSCCYQAGFGQSVAHLPICLLELSAMGRSVRLSKCSGPALQSRGNDLVSRLAAVGHAVADWRSKGCRELIHRAMALRLP